MNDPAMDGLVEQLDRELARDPRGGQVAALLEGYAGVAADWRPYALFDPRTYARNLVRASEVYELLVICWQAGQASPIHDHQGQRCWMAVLEGTIEETLYREPAGRGPLIRGPVRCYGRGSVAFITDDMGLHEIRPVGGPAVSLHLYSRPIRECRIFDRDSGEVTERALVYHSVAGVRQPESAPA
jgi:cysteine dioxygenase